MTILVLVPRYLYSYTTSRALSKFYVMSQIKEKITEPRERLERNDERDGPERLVAS